MSSQPTQTASENTDALLRATGQRITKPRRQTFETLRNSRQALTHRDLRSLMPDMDRVSLYRALEWLQRHDLAVRIDGEGGPRYRAHDRQHGRHHPHFDCRVCGKVTCLANETAPTIELPEGYRLDEVHIVARGVCNECQERASKRSNDA
jgi:Fur family ferric uptake transcriptional regulator